MIMKYNRLFLDSNPRYKGIDPVSAVAIGASIIGGIGSLFSSSEANATNVGLARENREWQSVENDKSRQLSLDLWNKQNEYNSPKNQRALALQAGYNPYLLGSDMSLGSGAGAALSPGMQSAPNAPRVEPINPLAGASSLLNAIAMANQKEQIDSNVQANKANVIKSLAETVINSYDKLGQKGMHDVMKTVAPMLSDLNFEGSRSDIMFNEYLKNNLSARYNQDMDSLNKEIQYNLGKKYGEVRVQSNLEKLQYEISEIVGRLNTMNVQNEALIKQTAADLVVKSAHAFMLKSEGDKFVADAQTANQMRQWLTKTAMHEAKIKQIDNQFKEASWDSSTDLIGYATSMRGREAKSAAYRIPLERNADALWTALDKTFGEYIKISPRPESGSNITTTWFQY